MFVTRTHDKKALSKVFRHPKVYYWISDDLSPEVYTPEMHDSLIYLTDDTKMGAIRFDPLTGVMCQVHIAVRPELWGKSVEFGNLAKEWLFKNTRYMKVVAMVPAYNRLAVRLVKKVGFSPEGVLKKAFLKNWELHDLEVYGLCKEDA